MNSKGKQIISIFTALILMMVVFLQPVHQLAHNHAENHQESSNSEHQNPEIQHGNLCFLCDFTLPATTGFTTSNFEFQIQDQPFFLPESFEYKPLHSIQIQSAKQLRAPPFLA